MRENRAAWVGLLGWVIAACAEPAPAPAAQGGAIGTTAVAKLVALSAARGVEGTASWTTTALGVDLRARVTGCVTAREYPVLVYGNMACADVLARGEVWDGVRGGRIPRLGCDGGSGGQLFYTRASSDPKPWTIGGAVESDLIGRVLVVQDPDSLEPLACGEITAGAAVDRSDAGAGSDALARPELRAQLAGFCISRALPSTIPGCPDPAKFAACASEHCPLDACVRSCSDHIACLASRADPCEAATECAMSAACAECTGLVTTCSSAPCITTMLACAAPTPDGPCSEVEACCRRQGARSDYCLSALRKAAAFGGDPTCIGLMSDWDFNTNVAFDPPCSYGDAGTDM